MTAAGQSSPGSSGHLRGTVLLPDAHGHVHCLPDATIAWQDGHIASVTPQQPAALDSPALAAPDLLLVPGLVDLHCHWPQAHVRGAFSGQLLPWLRESIWPAEAQFVDPALAAERGRAFLQDAVRAGTCAGLLFGPPFVAASATFLAMAPLGFFEGPALMEVNGPEALLRPAHHTLADLAALVTAEEGPGRVVISPRFAPNLSEEGLAAAGRLHQALGLLAQSHLSENLDEIAWVRALFPQALDYTDVYDRAGLLGPRTVMAHGVHLSDRELDRLAATGTVIAHCPTSNEALGSGRMPLERLRSHGVRWVLATDVGAGPKLSQLDVLAAFLHVHANHCEVSASEGLAHSTAIPGAFLAEHDPRLAGLGTFDVGAPAHVVAFRRPPGPAEAEGLLRKLAETQRDRLETLPVAVVLWGAAQALEP